MNVRIKVKSKEASGRRRGWFRHVTDVDQSKTNGYAFEGNFLGDGKEHDLPIGAVVVEKAPAGSVKNGYWEAHIHIVRPDGLEKVTADDDYDWVEDFLSFRDKVAEYVNEQNQEGSPSPIASATDEELLTELRARGYRI